MSLTVDPGTAMSLVERVHRFVDELRTRGLPISMAERLDAMQALDGLRLDTARGLHTALSATLAKSADNQAMFDEVFQLYFRAAGRTGEAMLADGKTGSRADGSVALDAPLELDLDHALRTVLLEPAESLARLVAEQAVAQYSRFEPGRPVAGVQYENRAVRGLRLDEVSAQLQREVAAGEDTVGVSESDAVNSQWLVFLDLSRREVADRAEQVRELIREHIREILVADRGADAVARTLRTPLPTDIVISLASPAQLAQIEQVMRPLQRKLSTSMLRKQRRRSGALDMRSTLRRSMATGGVPVHIVHKRPIPTKPKLYVLADVSGSVATFAAFTITLVSAMSEVFSRLRTFAFVENAVEITDLVNQVNSPLEAVDAINEMKGLNFSDSHTDYGRALRQFWDAVGPQLGRRSTVLIFGDARGNYRPAEFQTLARIGKRAGAVYWLNPESESHWGSGDSLMNEYSRHCTDTVVCRTVSDLRRFVEVTN
jgi:uncharacterized protein with von Willebrand factor type A (vWA) domain